eukprot:superscaffoldBa00007266_g22371
MLSPGGQTADRLSAPDTTGPGSSVNLHNRSGSGSRANVTDWIRSSDRDQTGTCSRENNGLPKPSDGHLCNVTVTVGVYRRQRSPVTPRTGSGTGRPVSGPRGRVPAATLRRPRDRHAGTRAAATRTREGSSGHERLESAQPSRGDGGGGAGRKGAGRRAESGLTVTTAQCQGAPRGGSAHRRPVNSVRLLLLLLLRTSTGHADTAGHAGAGQTDHCLSRMRPPPVLGPHRERARAGHMVQQYVTYADLRRVP